MLISSYLRYIVFDSYKKFWFLCVAKLLVIRAIDAKLEQTGKYFLSKNFQINSFRATGEQLI